MFSLFRKKSTTAPQAAAIPDPAPASAATASYKTPEFGTRLKALLQGSKFIYRDVSLTAEQLALYRIGTFFREPTFFDTTSRFGGLVANTRFLVVSSCPRDLSALSENPGWGLCVLGPDQLLKVIDVQCEDEVAQVTLLHVPDGFEPYFRSVDASFFEDMVIPQTRAEFKEALASPPVPELANDAWRARVSDAPGFAPDGKFRPA